jgi:thiol-disulfide isomerase/thioredoxin
VRLPLDVKSEKDLPAFKQLLSKKPLTIIMVYATWCPHCHTMMPHFDAAAKSPRNTVSTVKINETMLPSVNQYIQKNVNQSAKPIQVEGYPSILLVNQQAEKVGDVEIKRDTAYLSKVMSESGNLAKHAFLE